MGMNSERRNRAHESATSGRPVTGPKNLWVATKRRVLHPFSQSPTQLTKTRQYVLHEVGMRLIFFNWLCF